MPRVFLQVSEELTKKAPFRKKKIPSRNRAVVTKLDVEEQVAEARRKWTEVWRDIGFVTAPDSWRLDFSWLTQIPGLRPGDVIRAIPFDVAPLASNEMLVLNVRPAIAVSVVDMSPPEDTSTLHDMDDDDDEEDEDDEFDEHC